MLGRLIPHPKVRAAAVGVGLYVLLVLTTQFLLPGAQGGRGTPAAVLFTGLVFGSLNALTAAGLVLVYRSNRIINFAQTALGAAGGQLTFQLLQLTKTPFLIAFPLGVAVAALSGLLFDLAIGRRFARAPRLVLVVATIAVAGLLAGLAPELVKRLPFLPKDRTFEQALGTGSLRSKIPFTGVSFTVGSLEIPFGFAELLAIGMSLCSLIALGLYLRYTRSGVALRAYAENVERAALLGINTGTLSSIVWSLAGALSGVGVILSGLVGSPGAAVGIAPEILLPAMAAAVIARMASIPVAVAASIGIQVLSAAFQWSFKDDVALIDVALFGIIAVGLLVQRRSILRSEDGGGVTWDATAEQRPIPREMAGIGGIRASRIVGIVLGLAALVLYPFVVSTGPIVLGGVIALNGILALSVLVLTGWAGQVSLGQFSLAAIGGVVGGALTAKAGVPFWFAVPIATATAAAFAVLIGLPALRIKGLFLAVSTFGLAIAVSGTLFNRRYFGWLLPEQVSRPTAFLVDFEDERSMYFLCVAALVLSIVFVINLRRSRIGRVLIAVRENDANLQTLGISAIRAKLLAFGISGALAGFAGAIFVHLERGIAGASFAPQRSVDLFLLAVLGGVSSISGVLLGSLYYNATNYFLTTNFIFAILQPFAVLVLLYVEPRGLIGLLNRVRDGILRIVAQRRQLIVPSLFADMDPESLERRLIPLAEPIPGSGLSALRSERFALRSGIYAGLGRAGRQVARTGPSREAALIGAAVEASAGRVEDAEQP
jgi:branched-chain amino acid transport system permease protein